MNLQELELAAVEAAEQCLREKGYIALVEVFQRMGKLEAKRLEDWRFGRVQCLERVIPLNLSKINAVCRAVHRSAREENLKGSWTGYVRWGKGPRTPLQFTKSGDRQLERAWATHYLAPNPGLAPAKSGQAQEGKTAVVTSNDENVAPFEALW